MMSNSSSLEEIRRILQVYRGWTSDADAKRELPSAAQQIQNLLVKSRNESYKRGYLDGMKETNDAMEQALKSGVDKT